MSSSEGATTGVLQNKGVLKDFAYFTMKHLFNNVADLNFFSPESFKNN